MILPIKTGRLYIAEFNEDMAESVHFNSIDEDNRRFVPDEVFETVEDARKTISELISFYSRDDSPLVYPLFLNDGRHIGHVQAVPIGNGWEVGFHVAKPYTGHGYATEAVNAFLPPIMRRLGATRIFGICRADNAASRKVLEKCGFYLEFEGKGVYHGEERSICRYEHYNEFAFLERMDDFFNTRADTYDIHMLNDLGLDEFYKAIALCFSEPINRLLDLGCGTGLELAPLFEMYPDMEVTGIDLSAEMLRNLKAKYPDKKLRMICGSYFDIDFTGTYDAVLSTYSLHHFSEGRKSVLYRKIYSTLEPGKIFVFGDSIVTSMERQQEFLAASAAKRRKQGIQENEFYHADTPFTTETETRLMKTAGFTSAEFIRQCENTCIIIARK